MSRVPERAPRILAVDVDPDLLGLLEEWLDGQGCRVVAEGGDGGPAAGGFDLAIVDIPFPRHGGRGRLKRVAERHPTARQGARA